MKTGLSFEIFSVFTWDMWRWISENMFRGFFYISLGRRKTELAWASDCISQLYQELYTNAPYQDQVSLIRG